MSGELLLLGLSIVARRAFLDQHECRDDFPWRNTRRIRHAGLHPQSGPQMTARWVARTRRGVPAGAFCLALLFGVTFPGSSRAESARLIVKNSGSVEYALSVDGQAAGVVRSGAVSTIPVQTGVHLLSMTPAGSSPVVPFVRARNETIDVPDKGLVHSVSDSIETEKVAKAFASSQIRLVVKDSRSANLRSQPLASSDFLKCDGSDYPHLPKGVELKSLGESSVEVNGNGKWGWARIAGPFVSSTGTTCTVTNAWVRLVNLEWTMYTKAGVPIWDSESSSPPGADVEPLTGAAASSAEVRDQQRQLGRLQQRRAEAELDAVERLLKGVRITRECGNVYERGESTPSRVALFYSVNLSPKSGSRCGAIDITEWRKFEVRSRALNGNWYTTHRRYTRYRLDSFKYQARARYAAGGAGYNGCSQGAYSVMLEGYPLGTSMEVQDGSDSESQPVRLDVFSLFVPEQGHSQQLEKMLRSLSQLCSAE